MYDKLDLLIELAIRGGGSPLYNCFCCEEAERIEDLTGRQAFRVIDGRMQSLRKRGIIKFSKKKDGGPGRWVLTDA
jgi:hypothetical protein